MGVGLVDTKRVLINNGKIKSLGPRVLIYAGENQSERAGIFREDQEKYRT